MRVTLLKNQLYKGFREPARAREAGETVDFPDTYAKWLVATGAATLPAREATDTALERAAELDIDLSLVEGTGHEGRITVRDVLNHERE